MKKVILSVVTATSYLFLTGCEKREVVTQEQETEVVALATNKVVSVPAAESPVVYVSTMRQVQDFLRTVNEPVSIEEASSVVTTAIGTWTKANPGKRVVSFTLNSITGSKSGLAPNGVYGLWLVWEPKIESGTNTSTVKNP